jgi:hypothetical protein
MNDKLPTGGPAFPFAATDQINIAMQASGMTLRDWFAGQALAIVHRRFDDGSHLRLEDIAMQAYFIADAMIAEREETS